MSEALERRIRKLERAAGGLPCQKLGHNELFLFVMKYGEEEHDAETQAKIKSIRACEKCKDKLVVSMMRFGVETNSPEQPKDRSIEFIYGDENKKPSPLVVTAPWLRGIMTIGDG